MWVGVPVQVGVILRVKVRVAVGVEDPEGVGSVTLGTRGGTENFRSQAPRQIRTHKPPRIAADRLPRFRIRYVSFKTGLRYNDAVGCRL